MKNAVEQSGSFFMSAVAKPLVPIRESSAVHCFIQKQKLLEIKKIVENILCTSSSPACYLGWLKTTFTHTQKLLVKVFWNKTNTFSPNSRKGSRYVSYPGEHRFHCLGHVLSQLLMEWRFRQRFLYKNSILM